MNRFNPTFVLLLVFSLIAPVKASAKELDPRLVVLKKNVLAFIRAGYDAEFPIAKHINTLQADGSWADISYTDKTRGGWRVVQHLERAKNMAIAFSTAGSPYQGNQELKHKILSALNYWTRNDFESPNWWYPEIGTPRELGPLMLLMEEHLSATEKQAGIKILNKSKIGMTGQNKVWLAGNVIYRSLMTNDYALIEQGAAAIKSEIVISEEEGVQPDYSFHQHGPQQQLGNYGLGYASDISRWGVLFKGTPFEYNEQQTDILTNYMLRGMRWVVWNNQIDISASGRQLFVGVQPVKFKMLSRSMQMMPAINPAMKSEFDQAFQPFDGNKHFWHSDMSVHRRKDFYTSVKMSSTRVSSSESCNGENLQGYYLGDGANFYYQSGKEYLDIYPFWDWKRIPGTTSFHDDNPLPVLSCSGHHLPSDFVGGVDNGMNGIATLAYKRDGLTAQKSWFFLDDITVCLGAGISADADKPVNTTINQSFLNGDVLVKKTSEINSLPKGNHTVANASWLIHDHWAYYFPEAASVKVENQVKSGDWSRVATRYPSKEEKSELFTLWIDHGTNPKGKNYAYYVLPAANSSNIEPRAEDIRVLANTEKLQAVESKKSSFAGFVFASAGEGRSTVVHTISVDKPCVTMIERKGRRFTVTLSDPTHQQSQIVLGLQGKFNGSNFSKQVKDDMTFFKIELPKGPEAGRSLSLKLKRRARFLFF
jgi:chondroitin AC lyase